MTPMEHRPAHLRLRPRPRTATRGSIDLLLVMACAGVSLGMEARRAHGPARDTHEPLGDIASDAARNHASSPDFRFGRTGVGVEIATTGAGLASNADPAIDRSIEP